MRIAWIGECPDVVPQLAGWHVAAFSDVLANWRVAEAAFELRGHAARRALPTTLVALDEDAPLGSVSLLDSDEPAPDALAPWLGTLYVRPEARGRGVGAALVGAAVDEARRLGLPRLHLWTPHHAGFYQRLGWASLGARQFGGVDCTLMRIDCAAAG